MFLLPFSTFFVVCAMLGSVLVYFGFLRRLGLRADESAIYVCDWSAYQSLVSLFTILIDWREFCCQVFPLSSSSTFRSISCDFDQKTGRKKWIPITVTKSCLWNKYLGTVDVKIGLWHNQYMSAVSCRPGTESKSTSTNPGIVWLPFVRSFWDQIVWTLPRPALVVTQCRSSDWSQRPVDSGLSVKPMRGEWID